MYETIENSGLKVRQKRLVRSLYNKLLQANHLGLTKKEIRECVKYLLSIIDKS